MPPPQPLHQSPAAAPIDVSGVSTILFIARSVRQHWRIIVAITGSFTGVMIILSLLATPYYEASIVISPSSGTPKGGLGALASQFSDLGELAGIDTGLPNSSMYEGLAVMQSRELTNRFFEKYRVLRYLYADSWDDKTKTWKKPSWFARTMASLTGKQLDNGGPSTWKAFEKFNDLRSIVIDNKGGVIIVSVDWKNPALAAAWANGLVDETNDLLRKRTLEDTKRTMAYLEQQAMRSDLDQVRQAIYTIAAQELKKRMLASVRDDYAFKVLDPAVPPQDRAWPKRTFMVIVGTLVGLFAGILAALGWASYLDIRRQMADME